MLVEVLTWPVGVHVQAGEPKMTCNFADVLLIMIRVVSLCSRTNDVNNIC